MYPNGPAHIGHARTYLIPDVLARFKRSMNVNVLFPMAFHYTGTPILAVAERISKNDEVLIKRLSQNFGIPESELRKLNEPLKLARYFHEISKEAMKDFGLSIDWRREFTSIDPEFKAFIRWQFEKLRSKGFLIKGTYPVGWCPYHNMPVSMHDTKDDVEPEIDEFTIIKFRGVEVKAYFPVATLRPETVLGVTNIWINPEATYCKATIKMPKGEETWILACDAAHRLSYQKRITIMEKIDSKDLIGKHVINPLTGSKVRILPGKFVNPRYGTGVVMSVPAHAPYDYAALKDYLGVDNHNSWGEYKPIPLISVKGYSAVPAADVIRKLGVKSQLDRELLDKATKEVYKEEFERGYMRSDVCDLIKYEVISGAKDFICKEVVDTRVSEAREKIKKFLIIHGYGDVMYEVMNAPVYCRCGAEIVVKILENQWFIDYGNEGWKELTRKALSRMRIVPEEARRQFEATIDWLRAKACARTRGLGTELPWEKGWIIESLSDSTIYMAFYTVIHKIRKYGIDPSKLTSEFWDYVMLGVGSINELSKKLGIPKEVLNDIRKEFNYWYPLDSRHSGKDLIPNHLTYFIFNHVAIFPEDKWPKQIVANGWVLIKGEKMAKSKGNIRTLRGLIDNYSADVVRLTIATEAEVEQDLNFSEEAVSRAIDRLMDIERLVRELSEAEKVNSFGLPEQWLMSRLYSHVEGVINELNNVRIRAAGIRIFYLMYQDLRKYLLLVNKPSRIVDEYIKLWLIMMSWFTPFIAEELWHVIGNEGLVVMEKIPPLSDLKKYFKPDVELKMMFIDNLIDDIKELVRVVGGKEVIIYVAPRNQYEYLAKVHDIVMRGGKFSDVLRNLGKEMGRLGFKGKEVVRNLQVLYELVMKLPKHYVEYLVRIKGLDEYEVINQFKEYIEKSCSIKIKAVYMSNDPNAPDLGGRKKYALPWRPSIYIISNR